MAQALYRQYRSKRFSEVVGQEHITDLLAEAISKKTFSHAYLFTGPRGVGKTSVARILAHEINELPYSDTTHLDIIEIDAASNRRIDDIRDLREKVHITPSSAKYKVYIIDEVHMLTGESFNALLKTLEEPPAHVVFILATTELHKVPGTIASRTQRFSFRPVTKKKVVDHLRTIADKEKIGIDDAALDLIADHGEGSFRDSISLLDQLSSTKTKIIRASDVEQLLGLAPKEQLVSLVDHIAAKQADEAVAILRSLYEQGQSAASLTAQLIQIIPTAADKHPALYDLLHELLEVPRSYAPHIKLLAIIARAASKPKAQRAMPLSTKPEVIISVPVPSRPKSIPKESPGQLPPSAPTAPTQDVIQEFDWSVILEKLYKRNTVLHSVLKRANVSHSAKKLHLEFTYSLHCKKLEDGKYRAQLVSLITDVCGSCPEIVVTLKDTSKPISDPIAASVAGIMGGGEQVNA